ncbi:hypothetical protein J437_LFUL006957 [Ladona fulva]|uniref:Uncharacterized protein n=1 Tax=Ladona fulva TaxID=123851 RepID=A0A8K0KA92_LADFU|nr:hypothetical protein J437_LFUL006957 [Ladona fulva]
MFLSLILRGGLAIRRVEKSISKNEDRAKKDTAVVAEILREIPGLSTDALRVFQLDNPNTSKPRPLKVCLKNREDALKVFKNKNVFAEKGYRVKNDMTKREREYLSSLQKQLEVRREAEIAIANGYPTSLIDKLLIRKEKNLLTKRLFPLGSQSPAETPRRVALSFKGPITYRLQNLFKKFNINCSHVTDLECIN